MSKSIVVLFGAGASFGAGGILPEQPPLGSELYSELRRLCPGTWGALPIALASELERDFESGMATVATTLSAAVPMLMRDMAIYFVQFRPVDKASLYDRLVRDLESRGALKQTIFSTLNYECILEYALLQAGHSLDYFDVVADASVPVLKLHGSCNMFSANLQATPGITYSGVVFEGGIQALLDSSRVIEHCLAETALAPVMCQYMNGKPTSVSPSAIKEIQSKWSDAVCAAALVACIGIRPHPPDQHIWEPLARMPGNLVCIGSRDEFEAWATANRRGSTKWLDATFAGGYGALLRELEVV